jgi:methyl coenzyme M reductase beta subunit
MAKKTLPPLEVGTVYRVNDFEYFEFTAETLQKAVTGEETAILRIYLKNQTILEVPTSTEKLHFLLRNLMSAYPQVAIDFATERNWVTPKQ